MTTFVAARRSTLRQLVARATSWDDPTAAPRADCRGPCQKSLHEALDVLGAIPNWPGSAFGHPKEDGNGDPVDRCIDRIPSLAEKEVKHENIETIGCIGCNAMARNQNPRIFV
jgi:hypothetical protein